MSRRSAWKAFDPDAEPDPIDTVEGQAPAANGAGASTDDDTTDDVSGTQGKSARSVPPPPPRPKPPVATPRPAPAAAPSQDDASQPPAPETAPATPARPPQRRRRGGGAAGRRSRRPEKVQRLAYLPEPLLERFRARRDSLGETSTSLFLAAMRQHRDGLVADAQVAPDRAGDLWSQRRRGDAPKRTVQLVFTQTEADELDGLVDELGAESLSAVVTELLARHLR